jgi:hypothetical protein
MTRIEPLYFMALVSALGAALGLQLIGVPHPWPAAIAINVYGLIAWPSARHELRLSERTYAGGCMAAAMVLVLLEKVAPLVR